jgi:hypothetical protein
VLAGFTHGCLLSVLDRAPGARACLTKDNCSPGQSLPKLRYSWAELSTAAKG